MSNAITIAETTKPTIHWQSDQIRVLRDELFKDLNDNQFALFAQVCQRTGLDPFAKQIYALVRNTRTGPKLTIQTSIDGYRLTAQRSNRYNGQTPPEWHDGTKWTDIWLAKTPPSAARIGVYLKGNDNPTWGLATWNEYAADTTKPAGAMWKKMPALMLVKCAEALALRKCFPAELSGVYTAEEMHQSENATPPEVAEPLTQEQANHLAKLYIEAGTAISVAKVRIGNMTAKDYEPGVAALEQRIKEQEAVEAEVVEEVESAS